MLTIIFKTKFYTKMNFKLGTPIYNVAVYTSGGILLDPGKLIRARPLPENVELFEFFM